MNYNSRKKWYHYVSMEMFVEFFINFVYFISYYYLFIFELSTLNTKKLLFLILQHLLSESCQSIVRFSTLYFNQTTLLCTKLKDYGNDRNTICKVFIFFLLNIFKDDSNLDEWKIRHSIDSSIRGIAFITSFVVFAIQLIAIPRRTWLVSNEYDYYIGIIYLFISFSFDVMYFCSLFLFNYFFNNHFNIWKPLTLIYISNYKVVLCLCGVSFLLCTTVGNF